MNPDITCITKCDDIRRSIIIIKRYIVTYVIRNSVCCVHGENMLKKIREFVPLARVHKIDYIIAIDCDQFD